MATKKKAAKKKATKKKVVTAVRKKVTAIKDPMTKSALYATIAEKTEMKKKDIDAVFSALAEIAEGHLKKGGAGVFTLPGLLKMKVVRKPATKARKGINPFNGEETVFKAKPARNVVKILPLKGAKEMV
ncbi:MAG: HU family DNA-binding protein [Gammaproteobacteria bacterium]|nr:HU family DNA-binding protein [Gammaproteobacteria bacterium]